MDMKVQTEYCARSGHIRDSRPKQQHKRTQQHISTQHRSENGKSRCGKEDADKFPSEALTTAVLKEIYVKRLRTLVDNLDHPLSPRLLAKVNKALSEPETHEIPEHTCLLRNNSPSKNEQKTSAPVDVKMNRAQNVHAAGIARNTAEWAEKDNEQEHKSNMRPRNEPCEVIIDKTFKLCSATIRKTATEIQSAHETAAKISETMPASNTWTSVRMETAQKRRAEQVQADSLVREKAKFEDLMRIPQIRQLTNTPGSGKESRGASTRIRYSCQTTTYTSSMEYTSRETSLERSSLDSWVVVSRCNSESDLSSVGSDMSSLSDSERLPTESEVFLPYLVDIYTNELKPKHKSSVEYTSRKTSLETSSLGSWVVVSRCNSGSGMASVGSDMGSLSESKLLPTESEVSLPYIVDMYTNELKPKPKSMGGESQTQLQKQIQPSTSPSSYRRMRSNVTAYDPNCTTCNNRDALRKLSEKAKSLAGTIGQDNQDMVSTSSASDSSVDPDYFNGRRPAKKEAGGIMNYLAGLSRRFWSTFKKSP